MIRIEKVGIEIANDTEILVIFPTEEAIKGIEMEVGMEILGKGTEKEIERNHEIHIEYDL